MKSEISMVTINDLRSLSNRIGEEIAVSGWLDVTQARIDQFADATGDRQWIHVDRERASESPYKTTIAHGFLSLSLLSALLRDAITLPPLRMAINYGLNRVRFIAPVPSGTRIRARVVPKQVADVDDAIQVTWSVTVERENGGKPCCVAEWIVRYYPVG
jgi:acyl dehydratase